MAWNCEFFVHLNIKYTNPQPKPLYDSRTYSNSMIAYAILSNVIQKMYGNFITVVWTSCQVIYLEIRYDVATHF